MTSSAPEPFDVPNTVTISRSVGPTCPANLRYVPAMSHMYDLTMESITGEPVDLGTYRNTVCLVVNVASR